MAPRGRAEGLTRDASTVPRGRAEGLTRDASMVPRGRAEGLTRDDWYTRPMTLGGRDSGSRFDVPGFARFLTFSCLDRQQLFIDSESRDIFASRLARAAHMCGVSIYAWVLMPEHTHLVIGVGSAGDARAFVERLKSSSARSLLKRWREQADPRISLCMARGRAALWQPGGGYDRTLRDDQEIIEKINYIHANPVKRGLVTRPEDWAWSSPRWYAVHRSAIVPITPVPR